MNNSGFFLFIHLSIFESEGALGEVGGRRGGGGLQGEYGGH